MPDDLTYSTGFWRCLGLKMCQDSEYGTVVYERVTQSFEYIAQYASIMPENALMSLNMPEHGWILLNVPEYA